MIVMTAGVTVTGKGFLYNVESSVIMIVTTASMVVTIVTITITVGSTEIHGLTMDFRRTYGNRDCHGRWCDFYWYWFPLQCQIYGLSSWLSWLLVWLLQALGFLYRLTIMILSSYLSWPLVWLFLVSGFLYNVESMKPQWNLTWSHEHVLAASNGPWTNYLYLKKNMLTITPPPGTNTCWPNGRAALAGTDLSSWNTCWPYKTALEPILSESVLTVQNCPGTNTCWPYKNRPGTDLKSWNTCWAYHTALEPILNSLGFFI